MSTLLPDGASPRQCVPVSPGANIVGIDLSGPANAADTALVWFRESERELRYAGSTTGASDEDIVGIVSSLRSPVVGIDAPLSYQDGGGSRPGDTSLRQTVTRVGMKPGSIMAPTFNRMAYLTLRGVVVARALEAMGVARERICEVHPGGALALHGAPIADVLAFKASRESRERLFAWLDGMGLRGMDSGIAASSHGVAACGAALAAWHWIRGTQKWHWRACPPYHPYDFSC